MRKNQLESVGKRWEDYLERMEFVELRIQN